MAVGSGSGSGLGGGLAFTVLKVFKKLGRAPLDLRAQDFRRRSSRGPGKGFDLIWLAVQLGTRCQGLGVAVCTARQMARTTLRCLRGAYPCGDWKRAPLDLRAQDVRRRSSRGPGKGFDLIWLAVQTERFHGNWKRAPLDLGRAGRGSGRGEAGQMTGGAGRGRAGEVEDG